MHTLVQPFIYIYIYIYKKMMKRPMIDVGYDLSSMNYGNEDFDFIINI